MTEKSYNVILTGRTLNGAPRELAVTKMATLFQLSAQQALAAFTNAPVAIKKNIDETTAETIRQTLQRVNIEVQVEEVFTAKYLPSQPLDLSEELSPQPAKRQVYKTTDGIAVNIVGNPHFGLLQLTLAPVQRITAESSAVVSMSSHIVVITDADKKNINPNIKQLETRDFATDAAGEICLAAKFPGETVAHTVTETIFLRTSSYLASTTGVVLQPATAENPNLPLLQDRVMTCCGEGELWFTGSGAVAEFAVAGSCYIDTDRLIAWSAGLTAAPEQNSSNEPFINNFSKLTGSGTVWMQSYHNKN